MSAKWMVLVEVADESAQGGIERDDVFRVLAAIDGGGLEGGALHGAGRYAFQLQRTAGGPAEALMGVLSRWADTVRELGLPAWEVVRTEVLTPDELERDFNGHHGDA